MYPSAKYEILEGKPLSEKKHKKVDVKVKTFFQSKNQAERERDSNKSIQLESEKPGTLSSKTQSSTELVLNTSKHSKAEILPTLKSISAGYSNNSCSNNAGLFQQ